MNGIIDNSKFNRKCTRNISLIFLLTISDLLVLLVILLIMDQTPLLKSTGLTDSEDDDFKLD